MYLNNNYNKTQLNNSSIMKKIKIASLWNSTVDLNNNVIVNLIKNLSKKSIEFVSVANCDILIFGPYESQSIFLTLTRKIFNKFLNKKFNKILPNLEIYLLNRKIKPLRVYLSAENYNFPDIKFDFSISSHMGINRDTHLRYPLWKEYIDWSDQGILRDLDPFAKRFNAYYNIEDLISPQGEFFLKKPRNMCIISSHLNEPRRSIYSKFSEKFQVDGYGPYFNSNIKDHYSNPIKKLDILKNYAYNLCPENSLYPGYYTEKIPEAFLGKCLPISWADNNINYDFNTKAFINLLNYSKDNYTEICELLKDDNFLKKFTNEPLLLKKPTLDNEIKFINKILQSL